MGVRVPLPLAFATASPSVPTQCGTPAATDFTAVAASLSAAALAPAIATSTVTTTALTTAAPPTWSRAPSTAAVPTTATVALSAAALAAATLAFASTLPTQHGTRATPAFRTTRGAATLAAAHGSTTVHRL